MSSLAAPPLTHQRVEIVRGPRSDLPITVALHSDQLGPALGGCRIWHYDSWLDGTYDALRLSAAMTLKNAVAGLDVGGGKSVIAVPTTEALDAERRKAALLDLGDVVERFGGRYRTAEDVGTTTQDMLVVRQRTRHVQGLPTEAGGAGDPSEPTALGVLSSIRATLVELDGDPDLRGIRFTVAGLGAVGTRLARWLSDEGARLTVTDVNPGRRSVADELGAEWVDASAAHRVESTVFVPAGTGGVLTETAIDELGARAVVGPANNPLATRDGADQLATRGVVYAPDFVVNAGGAIYVTLMAKPGAVRQTVLDRVRAIGATLAEIFDMARQQSITPLAAAEQLAADRLSRR